MPRYFLTRVKVEGFRGINNEGEPLELKFKADNVNSVFAVNGAGKSSLFEALYYAVHDKVPKLAELQAGERPGDYFANRFHSKRVATIELEFLPDDGTGASVTINVQRSAAGKRTVTSPSGTSDPEGFLRSMREDFALLDYVTFAKFIQDTPLNRGRSFAALLGLSSYSSACRAFQGASETRTLNADFNIKTIESEVANANESSQRELAGLRASFEEITGRPLDDLTKLPQYKQEVLDALGAIELLKPHVDGKSLDEIDFLAVKDAVLAAEGGPDRKELETAISTIARLDALGDGDPTKVAASQVDFESLLSDHEKLLAATKGELFKSMYEAAQAVVVDGSWPDDQQCALCENSVEHSMAAHIQDQLTQFGAVVAKADELKIGWRSSAFAKRLYLLEKFEPMGIPDDQRIVVALTKLADTGDLVRADFERAVKRLNDLELVRSSLLKELTARKDALELVLPPSLVRLTEQVEHARQFQESYRQLLQEIAEERRLRKRLAMLKRWQTFIGEATETFAKAEASLAKKRITAIDGLYKSMFERIMGVSDVVPELQRPDGAEDLNVQLADFHGQHDLSARALLSESFRNALAISVFLAAASNHAGRPRFVVLDDVTSSFDAGHQFELMEILRLTLRYPANANGLQFIILSHDGLLEKYFDRLGGTADWHHQRLQGWPPMGSVMSQTQDANRLRVRATKFLDAGQVQEAEPLVRQYLEFRLMQVIRKVNVPVPIDFAIRDTSRMVKNCLDAINAAVALEYRANSLVLDATQRANLNNVLVPAIVGNWVSHYETSSGSSLAPAVLKKILQTIDDFAECFRYDDSATPPVRRWYKSLSSKT
jgi:hypothetical protein